MIFNSFGIETFASFLVVGKADGIATNAFVVRDVVFGSEKLKKSIQPASTF